MRSPLRDDQTTRPVTRRPTVLLEIRFLRQPAHPGSTGPSRCRSTLSSFGRRDERPRTNTESRAECGLPADGNTDSTNTSCLPNTDLSPELCPPGRIERLGPGSRQPHAVEKRSCGPLMRARTLGSGANWCPAETSRGLCPRTAWRGGADLRGHSAGHSSAGTRPDGESNNLDRRGTSRWASSQRHRSHGQPTTPRAHGPPYPPAGCSSSDPRPNGQTNDMDRSKVSPDSCHISQSSHEQQRS